MIEHYIFFDIFFIFFLCIEILTCVVFYHSILKPNLQIFVIQFRTEYVRIVQQYIKGEERSFTIIAFPIPEFGDKFEEMFDATVKINTLDADNCSAWSYYILRDK